MTTHEALVAARNLLEREGWQRSYAVGHGPHCVVSALDAVDENQRPHAVAVLGSMVGTQGGGDLGFWNDAREDVAEVYALLDEAIAATAPPPEDLDLTEPAVAPALA